MADENSGDINKQALEDSVVAQQLLQEDMVKEEFQRSEIERNDEKIAQQLQEKERRRYELKKKERDLAKQRRLIEQEQQQRASDPQVMLAGYRMENLGNRQLSGDMASMDLGTEPPDRVLRTDGRVEDTGDFSDFYIQPETHMRDTEKKSLQELQDEELARLLQDQEHKRGAEINRGKLREIEDKDAELARVMQEEEKLKQEKRRKKRSQRQHSSGEHSSARSQPNQPGQRRAPPAEPAQDYEDSLADREHNLKEHRTPLPAYQDPPAYPEGRPLPETPMYVNTNTVFTVPSHSRPPSSSDDDNERSQPIPQSTQGNVFAAVDPTYRNGPQSSGRHSLSPQNSSPIQHSQAPNSAVAPTLRGDEMYSNVDDIRNQGPVQAQRRSSSKRKSDKNGCLLQ
ncbi:hypothetical protein LSAT2_012573 [Lamellibrachia satsuma]|nr:hypothetical protein LSAT2_012573 [Lamellibrachia satsuma]